MEDFKTIENIARICVLSQSYNYIQGNLFIRETSEKFYKIEMSRCIYSQILKKMDEKRDIILERKGFKYANKRSSRKLYTSEEIEIIKANLNLTCVQLARKLDRTVGSVNCKLAEIRKKYNYSLNLKNHL